MTNGVMMQYFEWYLPSDGRHWKRLAQDAPHLASMGVTAVWTPPATKGTGKDDVGYGCYDVYDLGEFDQKGTVPTKYGTKEELQAAIRALHGQHIAVYLDVVMNHKAGADYKETFRATEVYQDNREAEASEPYEIEGWTGFNFPGRHGVYSDFEWHWYHFTATDYDAKGGHGAIFKMEGKEWSENVDHENGNYDYLMFANIDYRNPEVVAEMKKWGVWVADELDVDGFRLDAIKHINSDFIRGFMQNIRAHRGQDFYAVGEYWKNERDELDNYLGTEEYKIDLFDVPLHYRFAQASNQGRDYDLRTLLDDTLLRTHPTLAVTFVDNHDSQPGQALESTVQDWFKPSAYALILLFKDGYPCIFYGDYYGIGGKEPLHRGVLETLLRVRRECAYGEQREYLDHANTIGFSREGDDAHPGSGVAVLISNGEDGDKYMCVGARHAGERWVEATGSFPGESVTIQPDGNALFRVRGGKTAVWVLEEKGRA